MMSYVIYLLVSRLFHMRGGIWLCFIALRVLCFIALRVLCFIALRALLDCEKLVVIAYDVAEIIMISQCMISLKKWSYV